MRVARLSLLALVALAGFSIQLCRADDSSADKDKNKNTPEQVSYFRDVRPILQDHCEGCHQPAKKGGGYLMTTHAGLLKPGDSELPGVVPGQLGESNLIAQITSKDAKTAMPKGKPPLPEYQIELIKQWIAQGAKDDSPADAGPLVDMAHPPNYYALPVITAVAYSKDGKWLAVSGYHEIVLYKADGSELIARLVGLSERIESLAFSPDSSRLAMAGGLPGRMGEIQVWDLTETKDAKKLLLSVPVTYDTVYGISWSHDGTKLAFGCADNTVRAIDAKTGEQVLFQGAHTDWVHDTVFSKDSSHLITVSRDMSMKLIEVATQRFVDNVTSITPGILKGGLASIDLRPGKDEVATGGSDGIPKLFKIYRTEARKIGDDANLLRKFDAVPGRIFSVRFNADGSQIVVGSSSDQKGEVHVYNVADGKLIFKLAEPTGPIFATAFSADGKTVAAGGFDGNVLLINAADGKLLKQFLPVPLAEKSVPEPELPKANSQVSFCRDCMPMFSKLGCNAGTCHGSAQGKNGFKLSLRGYDPFADYRAFTDDLAARRFNRASPEHSLMLMKLSGMVPHAGGVLSKPGERAYEMILHWIAQGVRYDPDSPRVEKVEVLPANPLIPLPQMKQQMAVIATYTDGSTRDVTSDAFVESGNIEVLEANKTGLVTALRRGEAAVLVRYEGHYAATILTCMGDRSDFVWKDQPVNNYIDELVDAKLKTVKTSVSGLCTDAKFSRRVYLDLTGLPPTADEVRAFLTDERETRIKRDEVIDRLIGSGEFVEHWTNKWADLLQVNSKFLGDQGAWAFRNWIKQAVASNMPYDKFVYEILTAKGSNLENPPAAYYKVLRTPDDAMENTTQLFLAVRFNCNKCHDHPFERWTQNQHGELAAYFAKIGRKEDPRFAGKKIGGTDVEQAVSLVEIVYDGIAGEVKHPNTGAVMPPKFPYSFDGDLGPDASPREQLAKWITSPKNEYFAKSYVNRLWSYLLGTGFIEPVDDIRAGNPPTNPELLNRLTTDFIAGGFNVQELLRMICKSRTYQRSVATDKWNVDDTVNYSHAIARRLSAEVLYDTIYNVTGATRRLPNMPAGARAAEERDPSIRLGDGFLELSGRPARESACECERSSGVMLGMVLNLINGPTLADAINEPNNSLQKLVASEKDDAKLVEELFLRVLNRRPSEGETQQSIAALQFKDDDLTKAAETLAAYEKTLPSKQAEWERHAGAVAWTPLELVEGKSAAEATFAKEADNVVFVGGKLAQDTYTLTFHTDLTAISGIRLEAFTDDRLPANGPGRATNGNFALNEIRLTAAPQAEPTKTQPGVFGRAIADFSQQSWDVAGAIDGNPTTGWAVMPDGGLNVGKSHTAIFELKENAGYEGGTTLTVQIDHKYADGMHNLGKFRLSATNSARPLALSGPPEKIAKLLAIPADQRSEQQQADLAAYYRTLDADLVRLQQDLKRLTAAQSNPRLSGAQDLTWALLNSPAFLFNR